ncbi:hypothetical protein OG361_37555 [Streptomyces sp. NBC_00090]|uniref:hypothetical protein n=1 Tax=Streptomyces sp. NBC_00090 TaxID=2903619 RepID=UPI003243DE55
MGIEIPAYVDDAPSGHDVSACHSNGWSCRHAWHQTGNIVAFCQIPLRARCPAVTSRRRKKFLKVSDSVSSGRRSQSPGARSGR